MPDLRDLLGRAAGTPVAPVDLDRLHMRAAQRRRNRRVLTSAAAAIPLAVAIGVSVAAAPADDDRLAGAPRPSSTGTPEPAPKATQAAPAPTATAAGVADGVVFALITRSDGRTVTWDRIDYRAEACAVAQAAGVVLSYRAFFESCYGNSNPRLRTAPLDPAAEVLVRPGNDPQRRVPAAQLPEEIGAGAQNDIPVPYRAWRLTLRGGSVVAVEQAPAAGA